MMVLTFVLSQCFIVKIYMAVFSGALKINNEIKIISHVIISKMLTMRIKKSKT